MKHYYSIEEYSDDIKTIANLIETRYNKPHLVSLYRGSLGLGAHLSNILDCKLSIVDFQSYDGDSKTPTLIKDAGIIDGECLVVVDDLLDTGNTMIKTYEMLRSKFNNNVSSITIFGNEELQKKVGSNMYLREKDDRWIVFWWEVR